MDKPKEAIERMRKNWQLNAVDYAAILAYLDSLPEWPKELTRERLERVAKAGSWNQCTDLIFALAAIAPVRKKRVVNIWESIDAPRKLTTLDIDSLPSGKWKLVARNVELED